MSTETDLQHDLDVITAGVAALESSRITVAIINASTVVTDAQVAPVVAALAIQVSDHFSKVWKSQQPIALHFVPAGQAPPVGSWWLTLLDNADQAGALGYHDVT